MKAYLERIDHDAGMARFYTVAVMPNLFGEWAVVREWGRIGHGGTVRDEVHGDEIAAIASADKLVRGKLRRGYQARE